MMQSVENSINDHVNGWAAVLKSYFGFTDTTAMLSVTAAIFIAGLLLFFVVRPIILMIVNRLAKNEKRIWLRAALHCHVFHRLAWLIPGFIVLISVPIVDNSSLPLAPFFSGALLTGSEIYIVSVIAAVFSALLNTVETRFRLLKLARKYSIKSYVQVLKIILFSFTAIIMVAIAIDQSPMSLFAGLGAMTAVIMLIFRDSILGFVASIQLSAYDMIRIGDWIEMPKYGADGDVVDISLNTIKIQNFDKTIVTIPSSAILSEGIKNWRGMTESGGRRIKRYLTIDINTVKFCGPELIDKLCKMPLLKVRVDKYLQDENRHYDMSVIEMLHADKRALTNVALFRLYLETYLANHPKINPNMSFLVRELQNTGYGLPIEIYVFSNVTAWAQYEAIQSDIFDYIYSILPLFELEAYQTQAETRAHV